MNQWLAKQLVGNNLVKYYPGIVFSDKETNNEIMNPILSVVENAAINAYVLNSTIKKDYYIFSIYTMDNSIVRVAFQTVKNFKVIAVFGNFFLIN